MDRSKLYLGCHVGMAGPEYYLGSVKEALSYGANTFMFYTGAPQNTKRVPTERMMIEEGRALIREKGIDESKIVVHAPYIINLANKGNESVYGLAKDFLRQEIRRVADFHVSILVLHPGSHLKNGVEYGLASIIEGLNEVLEDDGTDVRIALETMAGKGSEMGTTFEELAHIISHVKRPEKLGVCFDTCHTNDAGYDATDERKVIDRFDEVIGLDRLLVLHVNDSKNPFLSHKDRHENIGYGHIGFEALDRFITDPRLEAIPKILETPYFEGKPPYKEEIAMFRSGVFKPNWRDNI